ncbi:MAG TPA: FAD:protein FMN transferase [Pirellulaceae bacterium]|nr:FAD:protein FMN transferase [Pirellulaceae bacterium]
MVEPTKTTRRDFLSGKSAAEALGDALIGPPPQLPPPSAVVGVQPGSHLLSVSREAMACLFEIVFDAATYRDGTEAAVGALDLVAALENQLTVYRDTSEVAAINRRAADESVMVEEGLFQLLKRAVALSEATGGAFDVTSGRLSKVWGFFRRQGQMPSVEDVAAALPTVGTRHLQFDDATRSVRYLHPGLELNLGAIGKGYALDRAADSLVSGGIRDFLIHGGNSSVLARGGRKSAECGVRNAEWESGCIEQNAIDFGHSALRTPHTAFWSVALRHPLQPNVRLAEFLLCDQALGTSGSGTQFFHHQGKRYGHILDPRSGWPAEQVLSATVIAPTAEQADALSTALYVLGLEPAKVYCQQHPETSALLVTQSSAAGGIELHSLNLLDDRWRRL